MHGGLGGEAACGQHGEGYSDITWRKGTNRVLLCGLNMGLRDFPHEIIYGDSWLLSRV